MLNQLVKRMMKLFSYMLIDTENDKFNFYGYILWDYEIFEIWNYYSLIPKKKSNFKIDFVKSQSNSDLFFLFMLIHGDGLKLTEKDFS